MLGWTSKNTPTRRNSFCTTLLFSFPIVQLPLHSRPISVHLLYGLISLPWYKFCAIFPQKVVRILSIFISSWCVFWVFNSGLTCSSMPLLFSGGAATFGPLFIGFPGHMHKYKYTVHTEQTKDYIRMCAWRRPQMSLIAQWGALYLQYR